MKARILRPIIIALITFLLGSIVDYSADLETRLGLSALFQLRGTRSAPAEVVIVAMDEKSDVDQTGGDFTKWRGKHADLIGQLQHQGVALIVFDLFFNDPQPDTDPSLAIAMRHAANVLAVDCVQTAVNSWIECGNKPGPVKQADKSLGRQTTVVKVNPPIPELAQAMLDHGPFFLSNDPASTSIQQGWTFIDEYAELPTLPVLTWFYHLEQKGDLQKIAQATRPLSIWLSEQRRKCLPPVVEPTKYLSNKPSLKTYIDDLICQGHSRYFDFYGPPKTIRTVSYSDVLANKVADLSGKVVFVGQTSRRQADSFLTPFTDTNSGRMVGVEIMATQFANLLENRDITSPLQPSLLMAIFGLIVSVLLTEFAGLRGIALSLLLSGVYLGLAVWGFSRNGLWLPVAVPLLLQLPMAGFIALYWSRLDQLKEEQRLKAKIELITADNNRLINQFIDQLQQENLLSLSITGEDFPEKVFGVCLVTDITGFTELAEKTPSVVLFDVLRDYFKVLGTAVSSQGGKIANIAGDGMVAIWAESSVANQQHAACLAALQMNQAVDRFNATSDRDSLLTRFGLHEGEFALGRQVGDRFDEIAIGDAINTASRIEGVNKLLGTNILASLSIANLPKITYRPVGSFLLRGKHQPIELIEIVGIQAELDKSKLTLYKQFAEGLKAFQQGRWKHALAIFQMLLDKHGYDGPTKYYLERLTKLENSPPNWKGYIKLETK